MSRLIKLLSIGLFVFISILFLGKINEAKAQCAQDCICVKNGSETYGDCQSSQGAYCDNGPVGANCSCTLWGECGGGQCENNNDCPGECCNGGQCGTCPDEPPSDPSVPSCSVSGPASVNINSNATYTVTSSTNAGSTGIYRNLTTLPQTWPTVCSSPGNCSGTTQFPTAETYWVVCNAYQYADGSGLKCSGNPFGLSAGWTDCGASSRMQVTVPLPCPSNFSVSCNPTGTQATINWNDLSGASGYVLRVNKNPQNDWMGSGDLWHEPSSSSRTINTVPNSDYIYDVQGKKSGEAYPYSGARCPFSTFNCPAPIPSCNLSLTPATANVSVGATQSLSASLSNIANGTISNVTFVSSDPNKGTVSPASDSSSPYASIVTGVAPGSTTITASGVMGGSVRCSDTTVITVSAAPIPSCVLTLSVPAPILAGTSATITATVTNVQNGAVTGGTASSNNIAVATTSLSGYTITVNGISAGPARITGDVIMNGNVLGCTNFRDITVINPGPWWQVKDGDVTTNGNLTSSVPNNLYFGTIGSGGFHGVPVFSGTFNLVEAGTPARISALKWNANTATFQPRLFNYSYFENLIPDSVTPTPVSGTTTLPPSGATMDDYEIFKTSGNLQLNAVNFGNRKVILLVDNGGNLTINGTINVNDGAAGQGFFAVFVSGNITVAPSVTAPIGTPALEGIYLSDGIFNTGSGGISQLHVRGSVASHGGITLQRDLADDSVTPSELFEFAPDQIMLFPDKLGYRGQRWSEVAP